MPCQGKGFRRQRVPVRPALGVNAVQGFSATEVKIFDGVGFLVQALEVWVGFRA